MQGRVIMANVDDAGDRAAKWIRWIARGIGSLTAAFWLFTLFVSALFTISEPEPWTLESAIMAGFMITAPLSILIAWWREGIGGTMAVIYGAAFSAFGYVSAGHSKVFAMLVSGGPFLLVGTLFLASWWRSRSR
jgi:hypothetical protein